MNLNLSTYKNRSTVVGIIFNGGGGVYRFIKSKEAVFSNEDQKKEEKKDGLV